MQLAALAAHLVHEEVPQGCGDQAHSDHYIGLAALLAHLVCEAVPQGGGHQIKPGQQFVM